MKNLLGEVSISFPNKSSSDARVFLLSLSLTCTVHVLSMLRQ